MRRLAAVSRGLGAIAVGWTGLPYPADAVPCTVPGTHGSVQVAVLDPGCDPIDLADQTFAESVAIDRSLTLRGPNGGQTTLEGQLLITGQGTQVELASLAIRNGCPDFAMTIHDGAVVNGALVRVTWSSTLPCPAFGLLFADGFETGNTSRWSSAAP